MRKFLLSCFGIVLGSIVLFVGSIALLASLFFDSKETPKIRENTVLHITINGPVMEQGETEPLQELLDEEENSIFLSHFRNTIRQAKEDNRIQGIYLNLKNMQAGSAVADEMRTALLDFRTSQKWIIAYAQNLSMGSYYLATAADKIYLHPEGDMEFYGMVAELIFLKKTFEKLKIKPQIFRVGSYKGAIEPFTRENLSPENREQISEILRAIHNEWLDHIAKARNIPAQTLEHISDSAKIQSARDAMTYGMVDGLYHERQVKDDIRKRLDLDEKEKIQWIKYKKYQADDPQEDESASDDKIAVIMMEGAIQTGKSENDIVGSSTIVKALEKVQKDEDVKAVVLRINSPGGEVLATDDIWWSVQQTAKEKPVIASMSDYAASGGYQVAAACDAIIAQPTTITGSIGVFALSFDIGDFLKDKLGITSDEVKTGQLGMNGGITLRPMSNLGRKIWQNRVDSIYESFIDKVQKGRKKMTRNDIYNVAQGRVWTGTQAKKNGLVDKLGNYSDALNMAAEKADLKEYTIEILPKPKNAIERIVERVMDDIRVHIRQNQLGEWNSLYRDWQKIKTYRGVQARMPFEFGKPDTNLPPDWMMENNNH